MSAVPRPFVNKASLALWKVSDHLLGSEAGGLGGLSILQELSGYD